MRFALALIPALAFGQIPPALDAYPKPILWTVHIVEPGQQLDVVAYSKKSAAKTAEAAGFSVKAGRDPLDPDAPVVQIIYPSFNNPRGLAISAKVLRQIRADKIYSEADE